jgi:hypothetical protein
VGQDGILRGDWQSPRGPIANRPADFDAATSAFSPTFFEPCRYEYRHVAHV